MIARYVFRAVVGFIILANGFGLAMLVTSGQALSESYESFRPWMLPALALLAVASIVAGVALWRWRRWGFWLLFVAYGLMLAINISFNAPAAHTLLGPIGIVLLLAAYWPLRQRFDANRLRDGDLE